MGNLDCRPQVTSVKHNAIKETVFFIMFVAISASF